MSAPLLLECDVEGRILRMSDRTRAVLGESAKATAALFAEPSIPCATLRFTRVFTAPGRVLLSGEVLESMEDTRASLLGVQSSLLRHYFQLQTAERHLSSRTRQLRTSSGATAIRQMEWERQRLGRELHTGVGQVLAAIRMQLEVILTQLPEPPAAVQQALTRIASLASEALEQVRTVSKRLHPPEWQRLTLEEALRQLWENSGIPQLYEGSLEIHPLAREPELEVKSLLYRAAQEALSNLMRHAAATRITMILEPRESAVALTIWDNGVGFDAAALFSAPPSLAAGLGLRSIRDQAASLGGNIKIESGPDGTKLELIAPYSAGETRR